MTGIERHERDEKLALLAKLETEHGVGMQRIVMLRRELYPDHMMTFFSGLMWEGQRNVGMR